MLRAGIGSDPEVRGHRRGGPRGDGAAASSTTCPAASDPPGVRIAVRGWIGFVEAASLDWLERRELSRDELRDLLIQALTGAIGAPPRRTTR